MTLRARLTLALVILVGVGLIASDVATYAALRSFLMHRLDQQLEASPALGLSFLRSPEIGPIRTAAGEGGLPYGTFVELFDPSGGVVRARFVSYGVGGLAPPRLPASIAGADAPLGEPFTVGSVGAGIRYRVYAIRSLTGYTLVLAFPLTELAQTLHRLLVVAVVVTLAVLAGMALLSWWTVRRGLRPLERIEETAEAIAAGDLSRRIEETDPRTEVGRLGASLNVMLGRIEEAMNERRASEEALRRFLADASHELRTPLTSIRGYAELFRRGAGADPDDAALAMRRIEQESARMGALVDELLFLTRAGRGRPIAHEPVDLSGVAADAVSDARAVDPSRTIELEAPEELVVLGDEMRLREVFANLLSNALVHTPAGTPVAVRLEEDDGWAEIRVSDRGPGLSAEEAAHVFEPFYRADRSRGRGASGGGSERPGAGLGLPIVAAIAQAHGGRASVSSRPGEGATFTVRIPLRPPTPPRPDATRS